MELRVRDWMSEEPVTIEADASAEEALALMLDRGIRHLPVVESGRRVVGVVSVDDLRAAFPFPVDLQRAPEPREREIARESVVAEVMTYAPVTIPADAPLEEAAGRMARRRIGCLPVLDDDDRLVGLLSETDLLQALVALLRDRGGVGERRARSRELEALVESIEHERDALQARVKDLRALEQEVVARSGEIPLDLPERGADRTEAALAERLETLAVKRLDALRTALDHAAQGRLGVCDRCGGPIPVARLRALPGTTTCVACARADERGR